MGTVISNLKARFGVDTSDFKQGLKDGEKAMSDFKGAAGGQIEKFAEMFGVNMRGVNTAISTAQKSINYLSQAFKGAKTEGANLSVGMDVLKKSIAATGIGVLVLALASLGAYFGDTERGAKKLASGLAELKAVGKVLIEHLGKLGEGLMAVTQGQVYEGWTLIKEAFTGIGKEAKDAAAGAKALAESTYQLDYMTRNYNLSVSEQEIKLASLRLTAKDSERTATERLNALVGAAKIEHGIIKDGLALDAERILNAQMALQLDKESKEKKDALNGAYIAYNELIAQEIDYDRTLGREKGKLIKLAQEEADQKKLDSLKATNIPPAQSSLANIKIPNLAPTINTNVLAPLAKMQKAVSETSKEMAKAMNEAFSEMAVTTGEFFGELLLGTKSMKDFGAMMVGAFGDVAVKIGKMMISFAIAAAGFSVTMTNPAMWPAALAAGIALVAIGTALKGAMASAAGGGSSSSALGGGSGGGQTFNYDNTKNGAQSQTMQLQGVFTIKGSDLVCVLGQEDRRRKITT